MHAKANQRSDPEDSGRSAEENATGLERAVNAVKERNREIEK
jgi:hypothetical protein